MSNNASPADSNRFRRLISRIDLDSDHALPVMCLLVPLGFGLYSLFLGADINWDLFNYHLYNAYAWLHNKLQTDLAPAGMQTYFNPLLDVAVYWANTHFPSRVVGFGLGFLHGLSFVLILHIVRKALPAPTNNRLAILLALAGCLTANFLSGLGNSMGDDTTALFTLASLAVLISNWRQLSSWAMKPVLILIASGFLVGLGAGLKLTNSVFALALCLALFSHPAKLLARIRLATNFGIGVVAGLALTGGFWFYTLWQLFGNPLYPQYGNLFPNPNTLAQGVHDMNWLPHGIGETILWPFIITFNSSRAGETPVHQIIWAVVYGMFLLWGAQRIRNRLIHQPQKSLESPSRFVLAYVAIGFLIWLRLFSIYRYIVAIEVLLPLVIWILAQQIFSHETGRRVSKWAIGISTLIVLAGGAKTWGHDGWSDPLHHVDLPAIANPAQSTVVIASPGHQPWAWMITQFPAEIAFTQVESGFPGTDLFRQKIIEMARLREGPKYAIIDGAYNSRIDSIAKANQFADRVGLTGSESGCAKLNWLVTKFHLYAVLQTAVSPGKFCQLQIREDDKRDMTKENRHHAELAASMLKRNGFILAPDSCRPYFASFGTAKFVYQWCSISITE